MPKKKVPKLSKRVTAGFAPIPVHINVDATNRCVLGTGECHIVATKGQEIQWINESPFDVRIQWPKKTDDFLDRGSSGRTKIIPGQSSSVIHKHPRSVKFKPTTSPPHSYSVDRANVPNSAVVCNSDPDIEVK